MGDTGREASSLGWLANPYEGEDFAIHAFARRQRGLFEKFRNTVTMVSFRKIESV